MPKNVTGLLLYAKNESTYGLGASHSASDVVQVAQDLPVFNLQFAYDGNRQGAQWSGGNLQRARPNGRTAEGTVRIEGKGLGSTYTLSATPPNIHAFLLASGLSGSMQGATWVYKPIPLGATPSSLALAVYDRGEFLPLSGAHCDMKFAAENGGPTMFDFAVKGIAGVITDVASPPSRSWSGASVIPPVNNSVSLTIGAWSPKVRSYTYTHNLEIAPRLNLSDTTGHAGFTIGRRSSTLQVVVEADALSSFNAYDSWASGSSVAASLTVGSVANNRIALSFPQSAIQNVERGADGPTALWTLTLAPYVSTPDADDDVSLTWL